MPQCKFSLYLKKAGLASRNIVHFLKKVILRCIGLCFHYHHLYLLSRLDQPMIQRIPAGLSSTVACLDITKKWGMEIFGGYIELEFILEFYSLKSVNLQHFLFKISGKRGNYKASFITTCCSNFLLIIVLQRPHSLPSWQRGSPNQFLACFDLSFIKPQIFLAVSVWLISFSFFH